jgi:hypothetical protein
VALKVFVDSSVMIEMVYGSGTVTGTGTLLANGLILTSHHVLDDILAFRRHGGRRPQLPVDVDRLLAWCLAPARLTSQRAPLRRHYPERFRQDGAAAANWWCRWQATRIIIGQPGIKLSTAVAAIIWLLRKIGML